MLSPKQVQILAESTARINIAWGPVRSGKTVGLEIVRWFEYVTTAPEGQLLMAARTLKTLERNVLRPMVDMFGEGLVSWSIGKKQATIAGRIVELEGANDVQAETKIRGMTLAGACVNEVTLVPESFFRQILARLSVTGAKLFGSTNTDSPHHWLKRDFLDREDKIDLRQWKVTLDDNPFLGPEYVAALKAEYTGLWYRRFILGDWVVAEGAVYDMFDEAAHVVKDLPPIIRYWVGIDYGTSNSTVFLLIGQGKDDCLYVCREWVWDSSEKGRQKTDKEYSDALRSFIGRIAVSRIYIDPSAASFSLQLTKDKMRGVTPADNSVVEGIRNVSTLLSAGRLKVHASCEKTIQGFHSYVWDPKAQERGEDKPLKENDHECDALRYPVRMLRQVWLPWVQREEAQRKLELLPHQIA